MPTLPQSLDAFDFVPLMAGQMTSTVHSDDPEIHPYACLRNSTQPNPPYSWFFVRSIIRTKTNIDKQLRRQTTTIRKRPRKEDGYHHANHEERADSSPDPVYLAHCPGPGDVDHRLSLLQRTCEMLWSEEEGRRSPSRITIIRGHLGASSSDIMLFGIRRNGGRRDGLPMELIRQAHE